MMSLAILQLLIFPRYLGSKIKKNCRHLKKFFIFFCRLVPSSRFNISKTFKPKPTIFPVPLFQLTGYETMSLTILHQLICARYLGSKIKKDFCHKNFCQFSNTSPVKGFLCWLLKKYQSIIARFLIYLSEFRDLWPKINVSMSCQSGWASPPSLYF